MKIENIYNYFEEIILRRGYDYYKNGNVISVKSDNGIIKAKVSGSHTYDVMIDFSKEDYLMKCSCPYESNCKHQAAVLYYLKTGGKVSKEKFQNKKEINFSNQKELIKCLNSELRNLKINNHYGSINYNDLNDILKKYSLLISEKEEMLSKYNYFLVLIKWMKENRYCFSYVYEDYNNYEEDEDGLDEEYDDYEEDDEYYNRPIRVIKEINLYESIFNSFKEILINLKYLNYYCNYLFDCYIKSDFDEEELNNLILIIQNKEMAEVVIELLEKMLKKENFWRNDQYEKKLLDIKCKFFDSEEVLNECRKNLDKNAFCEFIIDYYKNDSIKYMEILEVICEFNKGKKKYNNYIDELINLYKELGEIEKYNNLVRYKLKDSPSFDNYMLVKESYSVLEWDKVKKDYISLVYDNIDFVKVLIEEEMNEELFVMLENIDLDTFKRFLDDLIEINKDKALEIFEKKIVQEMKWATSRSHYSYVISNLGILYSYCNDKEMMIRIVDEFRNKYPNRKAMKDELDFFVVTYL